MTPTEKIAQARKLLDEAGRELNAKLQIERSRARGAIIRKLHWLEPFSGEVSQYYSQAGQDRLWTIC
ncbi:MAG: hypothetical protein QNK92_10795 [Amylibacter sp.]